MNAKNLFLIQAVAACTWFGYAQWVGAAAYISGNQSGTLYQTNSPYIVTGDILVPGGETLTIQPGVELQFTNANVGAYVDGTLIARGTSGNPVVFTSDKPVKQPGQWRVLYFRSSSSSNSVLENCIIECAGAAAGGYVENVRVDGPAAPLITNCTIRLASGNGLTLIGADARVHNCAFNNNTNSAIAMRADCLPVLRNNTSSGNARNAIGVFGYFINRTGTWTRDNMPYTIYEEAGISSGVTLTIEPGVVIQFERPFDGFFVDGTLVARGTALNPIFFTSDETVKQPGQWRVFFFRSTASTNCVLEHCIIEGAGAAAGGYGEDIRIDGPAAPLLTNCIVRLASGNGITIFGADARIQNCAFNNNTNFAIAMRADSLPVVRNNSASGNAKNAIGIFGTYITRSGAWLRDNLPYTIYQEAVVNNGVTFTIEPGTVVQFERPFDGFYVEGTLVARGTEQSPIVFTSDDAMKEPGQWRVLVFRSNASTNCVLENCIVECAAAPAGGYTENVRLESTPTILVTNCTIRSSFLHGMTLYGSDPRVLNCNFTNNGVTNGGFAISMRADCLPLLRNNTASGNAKDAIGIFGTYITRSGTWVRDDLPYTIYQEAVVNNGVTLTIEPGVVVQFERIFDGFYVEGTLAARGTLQNPIIFTSDDPVKQPGQWRVFQFRVNSSASSILENCIIEYGASVGGGFPGSLHFENAPALLITNCTIRNSTNDGIFCSGSSPLLTNCRIVNNVRDGLRTVNGANPVVTNSVISGNTAFAINNLDVSKIIKAQGNYWGHPSGPFDNSNADGQGLQNPSGLGDKVSEYVNWSSFLGSDPTGGELPVYLAIVRAGNQVVISWPAAASGYSLQVATNEPASNAWAAVGIAPSLIAGRYTVTTPLSGSRSLFRLIR